MKNIISFFPVVCHIKSICQINITLLREKNVYPYNTKRIKAAVQTGYKIERHILRYGFQAKVADGRHIKTAVVIVIKCGSS